VDNNATRIPPLAILPTVGTNKKIRTHVIFRQEMLLIGYNDLKIDL
jgi:hypothetical protein